MIIRSWTAHQHLLLLLQANVLERLMEHWWATLRYLGSHPEGSSHRRVPPQTGVCQLSRDPCGVEAHSSGWQKTSPRRVQMETWFCADFCEFPLLQEQRGKDERMGGLRLSEHWYIRHRTCRLTVMSPVQTHQSYPSPGFNSEQLKPQQQQTQLKVKTAKTAFCQTTFC